MSVSLGPLLTTFTPPGNCFNTYYRSTASVGVSVLGVPSCLPSDYVSTGYYSPGSICPAGYSGVTEVHALETSINCCPNGYVFAGPWPGTCTTSVVSSTVTVLVTGGAYPSDFPVSTQFYPNPTVGPIGASVVQVRFRNSYSIIVPSSPPTTVTVTSTSVRTASASSGSTFIIGASSSTTSTPSTSGASSTSAPVVTVTVQSGSSAAKAVSPGIGPVLITHLAMLFLLSTLSSL